MFSFRRLRVAGHHRKFSDHSIIPLHPPSEATSNQPHSPSPKGRRPATNLTLSSQKGDQPRVVAVYMACPAIPKSSEKRGLCASRVKPRLFEKRRGLEKRLKPLLMKKGLGMLAPLTRRVVGDVGLPLLTRRVVGDVGLPLLTRRACWGYFNEERVGEIRLPLRFIKENLNLISR